MFNKKEKFSHLHSSVPLASLPPHRILHLGGELPKLSFSTMVYQQSANSSSCHETWCCQLRLITRPGQAGIKTRCSPSQRRQQLSQRYQLLRFRVSWVYIASRSESHPDAKSIIGFTETEWARLSHHPSMVVNSQTQRGKGRGYAVVHGQTAAHSYVYSQSKRGNELRPNKNKQTVYTEDLCSG